LLVPSSILVEACNLFDDDDDYYYHHNDDDNYYYDDDDYEVNNLS
jgi:hypothetical protein